jgi:hypothetical protein
MKRQRMNDRWDFVEKCVRGISPNLKKFEAVTPKAGSALPTKNKYIIVD